MEHAIQHVCAAVAAMCRAPIAGLGAGTRPTDVKGWDSFGRLQVVLELERVLAVELPLEKAFAADSIAALAQVVSEASA